MRGDPLPDGHRIVRYVGGSKIDDGIVSAEAFMGQTSVNWLECADGTKAQQIERIRSLLRLKRRTTARLVELDVDTVRGIFAGLEVVKDPLTVTDEWPEVPCHAEFSGMPDDDRQRRVCEALADSVVDLHQAVCKEI